MTKTRKMLSHDRERLKEQTVTTSYHPPRLASHGRPVKEPRSILKKSFVPSCSARPKEVGLKPVAEIKYFSENDKIISDKKKSDVKNPPEASAVPDECGQQIEVDLQAVQNAPVIEKSLINLWAEEGRWMILDMRPAIRPALFDMLSRLHLAAEEAELVHTDGKKSKEAINETHAALKAYVYDFLKKESEQENNVQYWKQKFQELKEDIEDDGLYKVANKAFTVNEKIKEMGRQRFHSFHTSNIIKITKSAKKIERDFSSTGRALFNEKCVQLKNIKTQLKLELMEYQRQQSYENQAKICIEELMSFEEDPTKKNFVQDCYESPLKHLSTSDELSEYVQALRNIIREHPLAQLKKQAELAAAPKKAAPKKRWFDLFCTPPSAASDTSPPSSATASSREQAQNQQIQIVVRKGSG